MSEPGIGPPSGPVKVGEALVSGEFAPGIPVKGLKREIPSVKGAQDWAFSEQIHDARRAGRHSDLRMSDGNTAFSWAIRKGLPAPGGSALAVRTNDHSIGYMGYSGPIGKGYGAGNVTLNRMGRINVLSASPRSIKWTALDKKNPQRFLMFKLPKSTTDSWIIKNVTPTDESRPDVPSGKPSYRKAAPNDLGRYLADRYALSSKIDGGHVIVRLGDTAEVFSHRRSASGELIDHTPLLKGENIKVPAGLKDTTLRAEVFGVKDGKPIPIGALGGLMNAAPERALSRIESEGIKLYVAPFHVVSSKGEAMEGNPYKEHMTKIKEIVAAMPDNWILPDTALSAEDKKKMVAEIRAGRHPLTSEGVVAWPLNEVAARPVKIPFRGHYQVYLDEVIPMVSGGKEQPLAGALTYRLSSKGPVVGKIGTGFSAELRKELWESRNRIRGRKVIIEAAGKYPSGAFRGPSFVSFHL